MLVLYFWKGYGYIGLNFKLSQVLVLKPIHLIKYNIKVLIVNFLRV